MVTKTKQEKLEYMREYRLKNKEILTQKRKEDMKTNPEKYKKYNKTYYENNREKVIGYQMKKRYCECCDHEYRVGMWSTHIRTNKHKNNIKLNNESKTNSNEV
jgi:hypothetical protein